MSEPVPARQIAVIRDGIRRAGAKTRATRLDVLQSLTAWAAAIAVAGMLAAFVVAGVRWSTMALGGCGLFLMGRVCAVAIAQVVARGTRERLRRSLRRRLATHARDELEVILLPLRTERDETARLANALIRDLGLPTELTPAGTPEGSGAEVSGVEEQRATDPTASAS